MLRFGILHPGTGLSGPVREERIRHDLLSPFFHWDFHEWQLVGNPPGGGGAPWDLTAFPLDVFLVPHPYVQYGSSHAFWNVATTDIPALWTQHETVLFARDPAEQFRALQPMFFVGDLTNPDVPRDRWRGAWDVSLVPNAASLWYPPQAGWTADVYAQLDESAFWPANVTPAGPGAAPDGTGSVKAAVVLNHGLCSKSLKYVTHNPTKPGVLELLLSQGLGYLAQRMLVPDHPCDKLEVHWAQLAPYLDITTPKEDAQRGGFFANAFVQQRAGSANPPALFHGSHAFKLWDGRLTTEGNDIFMIADGTGADLLRLGLIGPLYGPMYRQMRVADSPSRLAEAIWQTADTVQIYPGDAVNFDPFASNPSPCDPRRPDDETIVAPSKMGDPCHDFFDDVRTSVDNALNGAGTTLLGLTAAEKNAVRDTLRATKIVGGETVYRNFRCAARPQYYQGGRCEYVLPAKRINLEPDAIELVFVDDDKELANPVYPIWLHLLDQQRAGFYRGLCDDPAAQSPGATDPRKIEEVTADDTLFCCAKASRPCKSDKDCPSGAPHCESGACSTVGGACWRQTWWVDCTLPLDHTCK